MQFRVHETSESDVGMTHATQRNVSVGDLAAHRSESGLGALLLGLYLVQQGMPISGCGAAILSVMAVTARRERCLNLAERHRSQRLGKHLRLGDVVAHLGNRRVVRDESLGDDPLER